MKKAADFRELAREALRGKWMIAVLVGVVASILGGVGTSGPDIELQFKETGPSVGVSLANQSLFTTDGGISPRLQAMLAGGLIAIFMVSLVFGVLYFVLGSFIKVGYAKFNLDLVDSKEAGFNQLFAYVSNWKTTAVASLLESLYVMLWSLLFIIPGIIASYSYAMTKYILADNPELTATEAISRSKEMMRGNRFRLFCLDFSFIGWSILCALTAGIGNLFLNPYVQAAKAAFYREVSGTEYKYDGYDYEDTVYEGTVF